MKNDNLINAISLADEKFIEEAALLNRKGAKKVKHKIWNRLIAFAACLCLLTVGTFSAYALSEDIRSFINMSFFKNNLRITEGNIPEGYTPIYDAEGLDAIRNDLKGNYILMKDIRFTDADFAEGGRFAGGWEPIGTPKKPFRGIFNGNGYVVYGLRVNTTGNYGGLFGFATANPEEYGGVIKNLGVSDAKINVHSRSDYSCYAGVIAGSAEIIAGCFVDKSEVRASYDCAESTYVYLGGLCGDVYIADSCYVNAKVTYEEAPLNLVGAEKRHYPAAYVGAFAGGSFGVINSLCLGAAEYVGDPTGDVIISDMVANNYLVPRCMDGPSFVALLDAFGGRDIHHDLNFDQRQLVYKYISYHVVCPDDYILYTYDAEKIETAKEVYELYDEHFAASRNKRENGVEIPEDLQQRWSEYVAWEQSLPQEYFWYRVTTDITARELDVMENTIINAISAEEWRSILIKNGMKVGIIDCYTSRQGEYKGFDMEKIWRDDKSGIPKLRIFD